MNTEANDATLMIRLPSELKADLMRQATINGRRITTEINMRLRDSLKPQTPPEAAPHYSLGTAARPSRTQEPTRDLRNSELEEAILAVIRRMPPEKQLAFLSLFK